MEKLYEEIALTKEDFSSEKDMWDRIADLLCTLCKGGYQAKIYYDEPYLGIVVIQFSHKNPNYSTANLTWYDSEKQDIVDIIREGD